MKAFVNLTENAQKEFNSYIAPNYSNLTGIVYFEQKNINSPVKVSYHIRNIPIKNGLIGFHIHENSLNEQIFNLINKGNTNICDKLGGHFNPDNTLHGDNYTPQKHVGDLINNIEVINGTSKNYFFDNYISLFPGKYCIINRSIVIHAQQDDHGIPGWYGYIDNSNQQSGPIFRPGLVNSNSLQKLNKYQQDSLKTGNAGNRIACGNIIEVSAGTEWAQAYRL